MSSYVDERVVITGIGLASPNGNSLEEFRESLLSGRSGVVPYETRHMGEVLAGVCNFDVLAYQDRREVRRGTRSGSRRSARSRYQGSGCTSRRCGTPRGRTGR